MRRKVEELLGQLTLEEKVSMLAGRDMWHTTGVERLGIPPVKVSDGPNGARGGNFSGGATSACFPCGSALGATWNPDLVERVGAALGEEARTKGARVLLAPTVNLHRSPLGGRNFECYSEDPCLTGRLAAAFVRGVQSRQVGCSIKHFVCNDSEFERHSISSEVGERALRELYLAPFEAVMREERPWSVMASYNRVNGVYASENPLLLTQVLRDEWGFDGVVVSDWFGTYSTAESVNAGLDLEMPGPARRRGPQLMEAVRDGRVDEKTLDERVRRLLELVLRSGAMDDPVAPEEESVDRPAHRALAREAAGESAVLLRNEGGVLPLQLDSMRRLAVVGPNAAVAQIQGGGSAGVSPHYAVTPLDGIRAACGEAVEVTFERGCTSHKLLPALDATLAPDGFTAEYFNGLALSGEPVVTRRSRRLDFTWFGPAQPGVDAAAFSARFTGTIVPPESGRYTFSLASAGLTRLRLDGEELIDNWTEQTRGESWFGAGSTEVEAQVELRAGEPRELRVEYSKQNTPLIAGFKAGFLLPVPDDLMERAVAAASGADAAVVVVGLNNDWEREGVDRADMELPGRQVELIERVAAANPRTVVAVNAGAPLTMDWIERVPSALWVWYPGQELGNAMADVLFGDRNPSGRLPTTFPVRLEDNPAYLNYPGENGKVLYGEGLFVGYRYYDRKKIEPRFPFGHGLSYTRFEYGELRAERDRVGPEDEIALSVDVTNAGEREGQEVVQVYVRDVECSLGRPEQELRAFEKIALAPGETRTVHFWLDRRALSYWDPGRASWHVEPGEFEIRVGASSRDIRARTAVFLEP